MHERELMGRPSRRQFLGAAAAGAVAGAVGMPLLTACTSAAGRSGGAATAAVLPAYVPFSGPKPDLPGNEAGVQPGYYTYPAQRVRAVKQTPGRGGEVSALAIIYNPLPPPVDQNTAWQTLNSQLGLSLKLVIASRADYQAKIATTIAGDDLPDLMMIPFSPLTPPRLPDFLHAKCTDLGSHLAGDAVKAYPNLANIPTTSWKNAVVDGTLFGVAIPRPVMDYNLVVQQNLLDDAGIGQPKSADDFLRLAKELTRPNAGRWAMTAGTGTGSFGLRFFQQLFRVPNRWRLESGGKLVRDLETDEHKATVAYVKQLYDAGVFYPGTATMTTQQGKLLFNGSKVAAVADGFAGYVGYYDQLAQTNPAAKVRVMSTFGHDGGKGSYFLGTGAFAYVVMRKSSPDRVREILRVMDYLAAPFGTEEYLLLNFGVKDVDYTLDAQGNPVKTARGASELYAPWQYVAAAPVVLYDSYSWGKGFAQAAHAAEEALVPLGVQDPTLGYFSTTDSQKRAVLDQMVSDRLNDLITGRQPMGAYDQIVSDWRSQGGDQIRKEFQHAIQSRK
jgi:putative aldouronate transport system substrate-binding protein